MTTRTMLTVAASMLLATSLTVGGRAGATTALRASASSVAVAPDVKRLVLVRHGEVDLARFNGKKCFYGGEDVPLSIKGQAEARAAAKVLREEEDISVLWSSPLSRAVFGAECIAESQGLALDGIVKHDSFREVDRGTWVGLSAEEVGAETLAEWNSRPDFRSHGGEALADVARRVLAAKDKLLAKSPWGSTTALVSHMWVTRSILAEALGFDTTEDTARFQEIDLPTASVSVLEYKQDGSAHVLYMGKKPVLEASASDAWGG